MTKHLYLSHPLSNDTPDYGGGSSVRLTMVKEIKKGNSCNTQRWEFSNHAGTHIDAPKHFFDDGPAIDGYPPDFWVCRKVQLVEIPMEIPRWVASEDIKGMIQLDAECLLIRTGFQKLRGSEKYAKENPGLSAELAYWLKANVKTLRFVGMDFISISRFQDRQKGREAHKAFLGTSNGSNPILPIEDMDLAAVSKNASVVALTVLPIRVKGADGSPVTVIAEINA
jgi:arylformamidase